MQIVVTSDDGVHAPGLIALGRDLLGTFPNTVVAASVADCGGWGTSIRADGLQPINGRAVLPEPTPTRHHALLAPPALIVLAACDGVFGPPPDVVVAGVNYGPNVGRAILHSGTIGAVLTAAVMGVRALAISLDDVYSTGGREDGHMYWETATAVAVPLIRWLAKAVPGTALNVNVPNRRLRAVAGVRPAIPVPGSRRPMLRLDQEQGRLFECPGPHYNSSHEAAESDVALLASGYITITPIGLLSPDTVAASPAARWLEEDLALGSWTA